MPATRLKHFLDANHIEYLSIPHFETYTAQETAASAHVRGRELAKTVMVKMDDAMAMVVLPATKRLDVDRLRDITGARHVVLASEREFRDRFPDCEPGAMPPFGNLYDMKVFVERSLSFDEHIAFNAGTHAELIQVTYEDFERLVQPVVAELAVEIHMPV